ncbi:MAG: GNAT family N-acetyltransferase [Planktomarina sp.]
MRIGQGFNSQDRHKVSEMFWNAFEQKLRLPLGPQVKAIQFLEQNLQPQFAISAYDQDVLLGVAGFKTADGGLLGGDFKDLRAVYGGWGAFWRGGLLSLLERDLKDGQLLMDGIFVDAAARGQGVGKALLSAVKDHAKRSGYGQVRLDVIAENPRAKALYLREGFVEGPSHRYPYLKPIFGFSGSTEMTFDIPAGRG